MAARGSQPRACCSHVCCVDNTQYPLMIRKPLDENALVNSVCRFLDRKGWEVVSSCNTRQRGIDIVAVHSKRRLRIEIEAKGATSSWHGSPKFGKTWKSSGVSHRVSDALYAAAKLVQTRKRGTIVALAFPDSPVYRDYVREIELALKKLRVELIWVRSRRVVETTCDVI